MFLKIQRHRLERIKEVGGDGRHQYYEVFGRNGRIMAVYTDSLPRNRGLFKGAASRLERAFNCQSNGAGRRADAL
jgi:hypothetical protein